MTTHSEHQIIIVGAGPAGISTALHLAKIAPHLAPEVLVLEKARHPRKKVCGGGITPDAETLLRALGLDLTAIPHVDVAWAHFDHAGKGWRLRAERQGAYAFRTVRRDVFDAWLAETARQRGVLIQEDCAVRQVIHHPDRVVLITDQGEYTARVVVGADGASSLLRRALNPRQDPHLARLLEVTTPTEPGTASDRQAQAFFDFSVLSRRIPGYAWDFPALEDGRPVRTHGIYDSRIRHDPHPPDLPAALAQELRHHGVEPGEQSVQGCPLRWFDAGDSFAAPHILLAGDAAGADVLLGEGISFALGYGALAAGAIQDAFARQDFSFAGYRDQLLHSEMGKALRRRAGLAELFYRLRFAPLQALLWRGFGWLVAGIARRFLIGWARRGDSRAER